MYGFSSVGDLEGCPSIFLMDRRCRFHNPLTIQEPCLSERKACEVDAQKVAELVIRRIAAFA